ncbi:MAG: DUF4173 domain-containing protein [Crocinitomicaceae bacterium]|nr:DUF4173 domain-containing protein [Crocinitomicaceae bacterium]
MKKQLNLTVVFLSAILFTILFYKKTLGLNLFIFETSILAWLYFSKQFQLKGMNVITAFTGVILTSAFTVIQHTTLSYVVNFILFFTFIGVIMAPHIKSILNSLGCSFSNIFASIEEFFRRIGGKSVTSKKARLTIWRFRIFLIPLLIIILFSTFYSWANPKFGEIINSFWSTITDSVVAFFEMIEFSIIVTFIVGLLISIYILVRSKNKHATERDEESSEELVRRKKDRENSPRNLALLNEYKSAVFLFISLNILLFGLNVMDINHVWLNFEWKGQFLKQFVHDGTYVLIFAILISILLVLYLFRANLNFYKKNKTLKVLTYIWIGQNSFLAISVGVRNWYYIQYFALAYKRIAIIFFLILTIYGLYSVYKKVSGTKSSYYLTKNNAYVWMIVLITSSAFNWDKIIVQYNFGNSNKSFVHLNYLSNLSNSALPFLEQPKNELEKVDIKQEKDFIFKLSSSSKSYRKIYMGVDEYIWKIKLRKTIFKHEWESKGFLEWNYAEYSAYNEMFD